MNQHEKARQYLQIALNSAAQCSDEYGVNQSGYYEVGVAIKALEKQIPKKPIITIDGFFNGQPIYDTWGCPNCGKVNETDFGDYKYCPICGQALDWGDTQ